MKLISSITRIPRPIDETRGGELATNWGLDGDMTQVIAGIGGSSPYLFETITRQMAWLRDAVHQDAPMQPLLKNEDLSNAADSLRDKKQKVASYLGVAELSGALPLETTTKLLTEFADYAVDTAFRAAMAPYQANGKLPNDTGLFVLAMGKMGAFELNYSSDIDLIVLFDDQNMDPVDSGMLRQVLVRATRSAVKILSDVTNGGYVFRTDLRLRPDPAVTPICVGVTSALAYYESLGRTWERAAFIKARVCAGDKQAGAAFLKQMVPFVWRKHLDFAAIQEAHDLRIKIRKKTGLPAQITLPGHDVKLGRGGIREIEFFTQTRQLIAGGRDVALRGTRTLETLRALCDKDWVDESGLQTLRHAYRHLRHTEHAVQMVRDAQTQSLPNSLEGMDRIAGLLGMSLDDFEDITQTHLQAVHDVTDAFFDPPKPESLTPDLPQHETITAQWPNYPALRTTRGHELFEELRPAILEKLSKAANPAEALAQFDAFLKGLPAGIQVFSLFAANPKLVDLITNIAAQAPGLSHYLGRNSQVLDAVLSGEFFASWPDLASLDAELRDHLGGEADYEASLMAARVWMKERHFKIGVHLLQGLITPPEASAQYAQLAEVILGVIQDLAMEEFARKYGVIPGSDMVILAMGSLGAGALNSESDLDLILIYDADDAAMSDGRKSLGARQYYARFTQALITAVSAQMPTGRLYELDMRLRPSGKAGPVATSLSGFESYQMNEAWTWEHLALTRARPLRMGTALAKKLEAVRRRILSAKSDWQAIRTGLIDMRDRLHAEFGNPRPWNLKRGMGGLQDIELLAQALALRTGCTDRATLEHLQAGVGSGHFSAADLSDLSTAYTVLSDLRTLHILMCKTGETVIELGEGSRARLHNLVGETANPSLEEHIASNRRLAAQGIDAILKGPMDEDGN